MQPDPPAVTVTRQGSRVIAYTNTPAGEYHAAEAVLHRAGFVPRPTHRGRIHHLPAGMTDPVEQRHAVTSAVHNLNAAGFTTTCDADLLDPRLPIPRDHPPPPGDQIAHLAQSISRADHTRETVALLSELTAPLDGVLDRLSEVLDATADWWEGLGAPVDPLFANRLRRINQQMSVSALEIQGLRNVLADRHAAHPRQPETTEAPNQEQRAAAALASSPNARRPSTAPGPADPAPATTAWRSSAPRR